MYGLFLCDDLEDISMARKPTYEELEQRVKTLQEDLKQAKPVEEALRESEEQFRTIVSSAQDAMIMMDAEGKTTFWNEAARKIFGYSGKEILGKEFHTILGPQRFHQAYREALPRFKETGTGAAIGNTLELAAINKDGLEFPIELSVSAVKLRGQWNAIGIVRSISRRKQMEEALRKSEERFRILVEESPFGVSLIGKDGHYRYLNPKFTELFGYTLKDIPTGREWFRKAYPDKEYRDRVIATWIQNLKDSETGESRPQRFVVTCKDGTEKAVNFRPVTMTESGDQFVIYEDISDRERLQAQIFEAQKMEAIGTLAAGTAHLFNNSLTSITGYSSLIEMEFSDNQRIKELIEPMKQSAHKMALLTSQLLAYGKGGKYRPELLSMVDLIENTLPLIRYSFKPDIRVETDLPMDTLRVEADRSQMQMVLSAIVSNANDAIEEEGRIRFVLRNEEIPEGHPKLKPGTYVCLIVEDTGRGMDEETKKKIFDPFFTTHFIGRGLGMAAAYGIVQNHNGGISIDSKPGKGTAVKIYIPAVDETKKDRRLITQPSAEMRVEEGTILVIDDEKDIINLTRKTLEMVGYRVLVAGTGKEATKIVKGHKGRIDLVLLDIKLPDILGNRLYRFLMEARPGLKVIVFSGYSIKGLAQEILDAGADGFIQKPFAISTLARKVKEVLEGT
jgi:two-component system cell cycle sensor histidine kinase/response regulator CckA